MKKKKKHIKNQNRKFVSSTSMNMESVVAPTTHIELGVHQLPIVEIKRDMLKMVLFITFSFAVLAVLKYKSLVG